VYSQPPVLVWKGILIQRHISPVTWK